MSQSLPPHPTVEALKKQAKQLLSAQRSGDAGACSTLRTLRRFAEAPDADILAATLSLTEVQFALAMDYGFENWTAMKQRVEAGPTGPARSVTVSGQVTSAATDQSIEGVEVRVQAQAMYLTPLAYTCTVTDAEGSYECRLEWNGSDRPNVLVQCRHEAFKLRCIDAGEQEDNSDVPRQLTPGQRLQRDVQLSEGFTLELRVEDEEHLPVEGAEVTILADDGMTVSHRSLRDHLTGTTGLPPALLTDAHGRLRIEGLSAAVPDGYQYVLEVDHNQYVTHMLLGIDKLPRKGAVTQVTVRLERGRRLTGRIIAANTDRPIEGAEVRYVYYPYGIIPNGRPRPCCEKAFTDPHGHFELGLPQEIVGPLTVSHPAWQSAEVILGDRSLAEPITIQMLPGHVVTGQVLDRDGRPAGDAEVVAVTMGAPHGKILNTARTDGQGLFKLGGLPVDQRVWLAAKDGADSYVCFGVREVRPGEDHVVLDGREVVEVDGSVVDEAGQPVSVRVACFVHAPLDQSGCMLSRANPSDRLGHFRAVVPRHGGVLLSLSSHDDIFSSPFFNVVTVTTRDGRLDRPLTIRAEPTYEQALRLVDAVDGQPIAEADITLSPVHLWYGMWGGTSNEAGTLVIDHLPPGDAEVFVVAKGYQPLIEHPITVPTGQPHALRLTPKA